MNNFIENTMQRYYGYSYSPNDNQLNFVNDSSAVTVALPFLKKILRHINYHPKGEMRYIHNTHSTR